MKNMRPETAVAIIGAIIMAPLVVLGALDWWLPIVGAVGALALLRFARWLAGQ